MVICICKIHVFNGVTHVKSYKISGSCHTYLMYFFEIFTSGKYHRDMKALIILVSNSKHFRIYGISTKQQIDVPQLTNNLWSWKPTGVSSLTQEIQKWHQNCPKTLLVLSYRKIPSKFIIQYISVKENHVALQLSNFVFLDRTVSNITNLMWWKNELKFFI